MRYINDTFDSQGFMPPILLARIKLLIAGADPEIKSLMVRVINDRSGFLNEQEKFNMCNFLGDEDHEGPAPTFLVEKFLEVADAVTAIYEDRK